MKIIQFQLCNQLDKKIYRNELHRLKMKIILPKLSIRQSLRIQYHLLMINMIYKIIKGSNIW